MLRGRGASFSALDGSPVDDDQLVNGVLSVASLQLSGDAELLVDVANARIVVAGDVNLSGTSALRVDDDLPMPSLQLQADGTIRLVGSSTISVDALTGGSLTLGAGGDLEISGNASLTADGTGGAGGEIRLVVAGQLALADAGTAVSASGTDGGHLSLTSCKGGSDLGAAVLVRGNIAAFGTSNAGGTVSIEARQGDVGFGPGSAVIDASGAAVDGAVTVVAAGDVHPMAPPALPAATVTAGVVSNEPCSCATTGWPFLVAAEVDRPTGLPGQLFAFSGRVIGSSEQVVEWQWQLSDGRTASGQHFSVTFPEPGIYGARLVATTAEGTELVDKIGVMIFDTAGQAPPVMGLPDLVGDVTGDGAITLEDAHRVAKHVGQFEMLDAGTVAAGDIDLDGTVTMQDALLLGEAVADGALLPTVLLPDHGAPGTLVTLISPELLDISTLVEVQVGASLWTQVPLRPARGYASFVVPLDATIQGTIEVDPGPVEVRVLRDGQVVDQLSFEIEEPQPLPVDARAELLTFMNDYLALFRLTRQATAGIMAITNVSQYHRELLLGAFTVAYEDAVARIARYTAALNEEGGEELAQLYLTYADANRYLEYRYQLQQFLADNQQLLSQLMVDTAKRSPDPKRVLEVACKLKQAAELLDDGGCLQAISCDVLYGVAAALTVFPADGPLGDAAARSAWASSCATVDATAELVMLITDLVATIEPDLRFSASTTAPSVDEWVELEAGIEVSGVEDLCAYQAGDVSSEFVEELAAESLKWLRRRKWHLRTVAEAAERLSEEKLAEIEDRLEETIMQVVDASQIGDALEGFAHNVCDVFQAGELIPTDLRHHLIGPEPDVGTLIFRGNKTARYLCPDSSQTTVDRVLLTASVDRCDGKMEKTITIGCQSKLISITIGDNGDLNDDIFEVRIGGKTVLTSDVPVRAISAAVRVPLGESTVEMLGRAAPDGIGTYFIKFYDALVIGGDPTSGTDLTPGVVKTFLINAY